MDNIMHYTVKNIVHYTVKNTADSLLVICTCTSCP